LEGVEAMIKPCDRSMGDQLGGEGRVDGGRI